MVRATDTIAMRILTPPYAPRWCGIRYFLFIGGSSTNWLQNPVGLTLEAFLMTLIFMGSLHYAALATVCASEMTADSKLGL